MRFESIQQKDWTWAEPLLKKSGYQGCDYTFGNLFIWKDLYRTTLAEGDGVLCVRMQMPGTGEVRYLFPAGDGDFSKAIRGMEMDAKSMGVPFVMRGFSQKEAVWLQQTFPDTFRIESVRSEWDYLYPVSALTDLPGKKYHGKRNHIAKFEENGDWHFEPLTSLNLEPSRRMIKAWYEEHVAQGNTGVLADKSAVDTALEYFNELSFTGGVLIQEDQIVGVTIGEPINQETYGVHVEKAYPDIPGAYPMLNREYVRQNMQTFSFVNREEDDGLDGLRKAKESYHPIMLEKYIAQTGQAL